MDASGKSDLGVEAIGLQAGDPEISRRIDDAIFLFALRLLQGTEVNRLKDVWLAYADHWRRRIPADAIEYLKGVVVDLLRKHAATQIQPEQMKMKGART